MALKQNYIETKSGFNGALELPNAYWRVEEVTTSKNKAFCNVSINIENNVIELKRYMFEPKLVNKNIIAQAYEHLKTLPEFANAEDC